MIKTARRKPINYQRKLQCINFTVKLISYCGFQFIDRYSVFVFEGILKIYLPWKNIKLIF
jgi:hypothetical protein